jgi:hypothetical protein
MRATSAGFHLHGEIGGIGGSSNNTSSVNANNTNTNNNNNLSSSFTSSMSSYATYFRRFIHFSQMDFEYASATVAYLLVSPSKVNKLTQWHHEIKGTWARDDPAFVLILSGFIAIDFVAYGLALSATGILDVIRHIILGVVFFILSGVFCALITSQIANRYLLAKHPHSSIKSVEILYAFDVHCNAFLPMFMFFGVLQYLLLPILVSTSAGSAVLSNSIFLMGCICYTYVTFLGFLHLPFLNRDKVSMLLSPCFPLFVLWILASVGGWNATRICLGLIF